MRAAAEKPLLPLLVAHGSINKKQGLDMKVFAVLGILALLCSAARAQTADISGIWQGGNDRARHVLKISKTKTGWRGDFYNLGDSKGDEASGSPRNGNGISTIAVSGRNVSFSLDETQGNFEGILSDDGAGLVVNWKTLYGQPQPLTFARTAKGSEWTIDPSPHKTRFVTVQPGVKLEVLDWGGSGPPLIFLAGLGGTGHSFDRFAPSFVARHHVYAITRRGFGASSSPVATLENFDADRLGDDVLAVIAALKLEKPVLVGHSIAGEELSSVGTRHPENIAGLIYLDSATQQYSFYNSQIPDLSLDSSIVRRDLEQMFDLQPSAPKWKALLAHLQATLPNLQQSLADTGDAIEGGPDLPLQAQKYEDLAGNKIFAGTRAYGVPKVPVLSILALPRRCLPNCDKPFMQKIMAAETARADAYEKANPAARVVRLPGASHDVYRSNDADVTREINAFMDNLEK
jgi:pimeloyl-ACP methyl ester carboxylesterase